MSHTHQSLPDAGYYWQRLSIQIELFLSVLSAFLLAFNRIFCGTPFPGEGVVKDSAQDDFSKQLGRLRMQVQSCLAQGNYDSLASANRTDFNRSLMAQSSDDKTDQLGSESAVVSHFLNKTSDLRQHSSNIRVRNGDGKQLHGGYR